MLLTDDVGPLILELIGPAAPDVGHIRGEVRKLAVDVEELRRALAAECARSAAIDPQLGAGSLGDASQEAARDSGSPLSDAASEELVVNRSSSLVHAVLCRCSDSTVKGLTRCMWEFDRNQVSVLDCPPPDLYKDLCERCFPLLRGERKRRLRAQSGSQGSGQLGAVDVSRPE